MDLCSGPYACGDLGVLPLLLCSGPLRGVGACAHALSCPDTVASKKRLTQNAVNPPSGALRDNCATTARQLCDNFATTLALTADSGAKKYNLVDGGAYFTGGGGVP